MMYYSKATGCTYLKSIHGNSIPADAVPIPDDRYRSVIANPTPGKVRSHDAEGLPILIDPPPSPPYVPEQVSRAQGKAALITAGLWPDVLVFVESITDPTEKALAEVALNDTTHWRRDSPTMQAISTALGIAREQVDELFIQASKIEL